jgi:hypothetical protein
MKKNALSTLVIVSLIFLGLSKFSSASVASSEKNSIDLEQVQQAHRAARTNPDAPTIDRALDVADSFLKTHPQDGLVLTYRGSFAAMRAKASWMPWKKLSMLHEGVAQMDDGVALVIRNSKENSSEEITARMVRGITSARIPKTFGRGSVAVGDFRSITQSPLFVKMKPDDQATALTWLSVLVKRQGHDEESTVLLNRAKTIDATVVERVAKESE